MAEVYLMLSRPDLRSGDLVQWLRNEHMRSSEFNLDATSVMRVVMHACRDIAPAVLEAVMPLVSEPDCRTIESCKSARLMWWTTCAFVEGKALQTHGALGAIYMKLLQHPVHSPILESDALKVCLYVLLCTYVPSPAATFSLRYPSLHSLSQCMQRLAYIDAKLMKSVFIVDERVVAHYSPVYAFASLGYTKLVHHLVHRAKFPPPVHVFSKASWAKVS